MSVGVPWSRRPLQPFRTLRDLIGLTVVVGIMVAAGFTCLTMLFAVCLATLSVMFKDRVAGFLRGLVGPLC